jgi:nucleoside-diphosphate-sugar epimerase
MSRLLLTGATGFIGSHLVKKFRAAGWEINALVRKIPERKTDGVEYMLFDLENPQLPALDFQIDAFIHAAYVKPSRDDTSYAANLHATKILVDAMEAKHVPVKIFLSSLSAKENAASGYGKQKFDLAQFFSGAGGTIIRAGLVIGNGGLFHAMQKHLRTKRTIPLFGDGDQPVQTVHVDDLVDSIYKITANQVKGEFVIAEETPVPYEEFYRELALRLGVKPRFVKVSYGAAAALISFANFLGRELPVTKDNLLGLKQMEFVPSSGDLKKLGIKLRPWKESLELRS